MRDASGKPVHLSYYYYTKQFRAVASAAGVKDASTLSPRGLRAGGATDDILSGLPKAHAMSKGGWSTTAAFDRYGRANELAALDADAAARSPPPATNGNVSKRQKTRH